MSVSNLLYKAVSASHRPPPPQPPGAEPLPPVKTTSLVFLSPDFQLSPEEETLLLDMLFKSRLTPNLTLFDLLFFDLHKQLSNVAKLVLKEDFEKSIESLEICYATLVENNPRDLEPLHAFLKNIILNVIKSNCACNSLLSLEERKVKAAGDTKFITDTLFKRVQLFKKFAETPNCHPQLFNEPLSTLAGNERIVAKINPELTEIFDNNSLFLMVVCNSLQRTNPQLTLVIDATTALIQVVKSFGDLKEDGFVNELTIAKKCLPVYQPLSPHLFKIFQESFEYYDQIIEQSLTTFKSLQTKERALAFQRGAPPSLRDSSKPLLDPDDILAEFKLDNMIEPSFQLTPEESNLIQHLFNYPLDAELTMLDILGFALYDKMEDLKCISPHFNKMISDFQGFSSAHCIRLYVGLFRSNSGHVKMLGAINAFSEKHAEFPHTFSKWLDQEIGKFRLSVNQEKSPKKKDILAQFDKTVLPIRNLIAKLLTCKGHFPLLLNSATTYQHSDALKKEIKNGRQTLQRYWDYVKCGYQYGVKENLFGVICQFDTIMKRELPFSLPPKAREMDAFGTNIIIELYQTMQIRTALQSDLNLAACGRLDHKTWHERNRITAETEKPQLEFIEQLFCTYSLLGMYSAFLSDVLRLVEKRIFPRGTITTQACYFRLIHNIRTPSIFQSSSPILPNSIPSRFAAIFTTMRNELKHHKPLFDYSNTAVEVQYGVFNHSKWLEFLIPREKFILEVFGQTLHSLKFLKKDLLHDLENTWSSLSLEELQKLDGGALQEALFQEGLMLMRPLLILSDMLAILQKRHYLEEAALIPRELADIMKLDEIKPLLKKLIKVKTPLPPPVFVEEPHCPSPVFEEETSKPPIRKPKKAPAVQKKEKPVPIQQHPLSPTAEPSPEILELADLTKSREVLRRLKELDFFEVRQTGSHHILEGPQGGTVVVPNNNNLPRGTRNSIMDQAAHALTQQRQTSERFAQ